MLDGPEAVRRRLILIDKEALQLQGFKARARNWANEDPMSETDRLPEQQRINELQARITKLEEESEEEDSEEPAEEDG